MKKLFFAFLLLFSSVAFAQNGCGASINWTDPLCQTIGSGTLNSSKWTVVSRHGEYAQSETECNIPSAISAGSGSLVITATASAYTCGDFNTTGSVRTAAASWPYSTGDVQWNTFSFTFGTIVFQTTYPASTANLWPSHWLLATNCQTTNKYTGDVGIGTCPNFGTTGYDEIDMIECYGGSCNMNLYHGAGTTSCFFPAPNWDTSSHTWMMIWTSTSIVMKRDGTQVCSFSTNIPQVAMFMLMQIQTGGVGGTPTNAQLPGTLTTNFVKVCNTTDGSCSSVASNDASVTFFDNFTSIAAANTTFAVHGVR